MIRQDFRIIGACAVLAVCSLRGVAQSAYRELFVADPTVMVWDGRYYLAGTSDDRGAKDFRLYVSDDMRRWQVAGECLGVGDMTFGTQGFWAPQFFRTNSGEWLFLYTANEQVAVASAQSIDGKFMQDRVRPLDGKEHNIDPFLFRDDDGKHYLYHVRFDNGNYLWVCEYDIERNEIVEGTLKKCFGVTQKWERTDAEPRATVMEGPTVLKRSGKYYMFYSANHFQSPDYAVGYAVADSPYGPWRKADGNPILHRDILGENGTGHGDVFEGVDGKLYYVYHVHNSDKKPTPRRTRIVELKETMGVDGVCRYEVDRRKVIVPVVVDFR